MLSILRLLCLALILPSSLATSPESSHAEEDEIDKIVAQVNPKVELHLHFEGTVRHATAYELLKKKNLSVVGDGSEQSFIDSLQALSLPETFFIILSSIRGDLEALERVAYELCQTQAEGGVIYTEIHYAPHYFLPESFHRDANSSKITIRDIVKAINRGLDKGQHEYKVVVRSILMLVRSRPQWSMDIASLAIQFRNNGLVGIDLGSDILGVTVGPNEEIDNKNELLTFQKEHIAAFALAARYGVKRTVHAGFLGPAEMVMKSLQLLKVNRIGHGYRIVEDEKLYKQAIEMGIHFEGSPTTASLIGTGENNPTVRYALDGVSFSASSDLPTIAKTNLSDQYRLLAKSGVTLKQMQQSNINAMQNAFAEPELKLAVLTILYNAYGIKPQLY